MENKNGLWYRTAIRIAFMLAAVGCLPLSAFSQANTISDKIYWKQAGNVYTPHLDAVLGSIPGKVAIPPAGPTANGQLLEQLVNEWPKAKAESTVSLPGGQTSPPITTRARIKPQLAGPAIARFAVKVAYPLQVASALYDLAKELGFLTTRNPDGSIKVEQADPAVCTVAPCYTYNGMPTPEAGAARLLGKAPAVDPNKCVGNQFAVFFVSYVGFNQATNQAEFVRAYCGDSVPWSTNGFATLTKTLVPPASPTWLPSSPQALGDAIAAKPGFATGSAVSRVIAEASAAGEQFPTEKPVVSGPATSPGPKSTTTKADGSTVTTTNTNNFTYAGDTVTHTTTTVVNNYNPTTNITTTETTVKEPAKEEEKKDECTENPDRVGCSELDTPEGEIPKDTQTITFQEEAVLGGGSCPANLTANVGTLGRTVTVWNWTKTCELALPLRFMVLLLATFAAFLIVMPGGART
jgi:hypothetical protein